MHARSLAPISRPYVCIPMVMVMMVHMYVMIVQVQVMDMDMEAAWHVCAGDGRGDEGRAHIHTHAQRAGEQGSRGGREAGRRDKHKQDDRVIRHALTNKKNRNDESKNKND